MTYVSYKKKKMKKGDNRGEIETYTPEDQQHKTPELLISIVSGFMIDKIERLPRATRAKKVKQKNYRFDKQNKSSSSMSC